MNTLRRIYCAIFGHKNGQWFANLTGSPLDMSSLLVRSCDRCEELIVGKWKDYEKSAVAKSLNRDRIRIELREDTHE